MLLLSLQSFQSLQEHLASSPISFKDMQLEHQQSTIRTASRSNTTSFVCSSRYPSDQLAIICTTILSVCNIPAARMHQLCQGNGEPTARQPVATRAVRWNSSQPGKRVSTRLAPVPAHATTLLSPPLLGQNRSSLLHHHEPRPPDPVVNMLESVRSAGASPVYTSGDVLLLGVRPVHMARLCCPVAG